MSEREPGEKISFLQIVLTTIAAAFGVQSSKNHERDFKQRSIVPYVVAGVVFTVVFVLAVAFAVKMVLNSAGATG